VRGIVPEGLHEAGVDEALSRQVPPFDALSLDKGFAVGSLTFNVPVRTGEKKCFAKTMRNSSEGWI
jgi:hypothetical protein